ncbi:YceI family protein [Aquimarina sp. SS2-1]|uniref:YceI family protein n=1 Tax=Aquimarina besae TaxID=3342247 RepID=UPI00366FD008
MKIVQLIILTLSLILGVQEIHSQNYILNTKKSTMFWTGKAAFNSYSLKGTIAPKKGTLSMTDAVISDLNIIINMKSIDHENKDLKDHLKNEDFFEVKTYPEATFSIHNEAVVKNDSIDLMGKLTIKGKTNTENIPVTIERTKSGIILKFKYAIDRTKYGINHNSPSIFKRMKENAIADEFILEGRLVFSE